MMPADSTTREKRRKKREEKRAKENRQRGKVGILLTMANGL